MGCVGEGGRPMAVTKDVNRLLYWTRLAKQANIERSDMCTGWLIPAVKPKDTIQIHETPTLKTSLSLAHRQQRRLDANLDEVLIGLFAWCVV
jgi:hypothetical protein